MATQKHSPDAGGGGGGTSSPNTASLVGATIRNMIDGVIVIDDSGLVELFNPAAEHCFGYGADEVIGHNISMLMPEPHRTEHDGYIGNYLKTGQAKIIGIGREVIGRRKNGTEFPLELSVSELPLGEKRCFLGTVRDITEKKAEALRIDAEAASLNAALDAIGVSQMMIEFEPDGKIISANENFLDTMGYQLSEIEGQHHRIFCEPSYSESPDYAQFWETLRNGQFQSGELMRITKTGKEVWFQAAYSPVMDNGKVVKILKNAVDVTGRVAAQRTIAAQSRSLLELSTPVIHLWDGIVMMPLIGVIDTTRAKQITENLLQRIAAKGATVAILDITGVPVMDTSVAQHLLKTVTAAQMLGSKIILTGISPETAQTLVKLGIDLSQVNTRGTLSAGLAEAFTLCGQQVTAIGRT